MPFDAKDPRASIASLAKAGSTSATDFAGTEYVKFYQVKPDETSPGAQTWYARGQNLILACTEALADAVLSRTGQPDEYVVLLPDPNMALDITAKGAPNNNIRK